MEAVMPWSVYIGVAVVFVIAGLVKGVVGLGLPTVAMALLTLVMPPVEAAALLVVPSLVTNLWQALPWSEVKPLWRRIGTMQYGVLIGTLAGVLLFGVSAGAWSHILLGLALVAYALWGMWGVAPQISDVRQRWLGPVTGGVTGAITAVTGVFVIPAVPYLQALHLPRERLIQAMGISFTVSTIALALGLWMTGNYTPATAGMSFVMLLPALAGMAIGQKLRARLSPLVFKQCFFVSLALLGVYQLVKALY